MKNKESIKITLESFDHIVLNRAMGEIIGTVRRTGAGIKGPIPLPTKIQNCNLLQTKNKTNDL